MSQENVGNEQGLTIVFDVSKNEEGTPQKNLKKLVRKLKLSHKVT